jgi:hypothetical protein
MFLGERGLSRYFVTANHNCFIKPHGLKILLFTEERIFGNPRLCNVEISIRGIVQFSFEFVTAMPMLGKP